VVVSRGLSTSPHVGMPGTAMVSERAVCLDTGPWVAFLNRRDQYHAWVTAQFAQLQPPLLTCEAVVSETCFLVRTWRGGAEAALAFLERGR